MRSRLAAKITVLIVVVLIIGFGASTIWTIQREADLLPEVMESIKKMERPPAAPMTGPLFTRAVETLQTQEVLETRNGIPLFTLVHPIPNQERCQGCHGSDHKVRAVVRVATSMAPVFADVRMQQNRQIGIGLLTIVA